MNSMTTLTVTTAVVVCAILASLTFLAYTGKIDGGAVVALLSAILGGVLVHKTNGNGNGVKHD